MTRKHWPSDDPEHHQQRTLLPVEDLPLFSQPAIRETPPGMEVGMAALAGTASRAKNAELITQLIPIAQRLAHAAGPEGVTVTELRKAGVEAGILTGHEAGHELSFLGAVMRRAGLHATGEHRRSSLTVSHGKLQVVWRAG